jgi:hypothetical protein
LCFFLKVANHFETHKNKWKNYCFHSDLQRFEGRGHDINFLLYKNKYFQITGVKIQVEDAGSMVLLNYPASQPRKPRLEVFPEFILALLSSRAVIAQSV